MKNLKLIFLDLDGTLIDSRADIVSCVNRMLGHFSCPSLTSFQVSSFVGVGMRDLIGKCLRAVKEGVDENLVDEATDRFENFYLKHCLDETNFYAGVRQGLETLSKKAPLVLLTNKPRKLTEKILKGLKGYDLFSKTITGDDPWPKKPDPSSALATLREFGVKASQSVLVGDSRIDYQTAKNAKMKIALLTFGFEDPESLARLAPDFLAHEFNQVVEYLIS